MLKELANFDLEAVHTLNKRKTFSLAEGIHLERAQPVLMVSNPGLGKTHLATGSGLRLPKTWGDLE